MTLSTGNCGDTVECGKKSNFLRHLLIFPFSGVRDLSRWSLRAAVAVHPGVLARVRQLSDQPAIVCCVQSRLPIRVPQGADGPELQLPKLLSSPFMELPRLIWSFSTWTRSIVNLLICLLDLLFGRTAISTTKFRHTTPISFRLRGRVPRIQNSSIPLCSLPLLTLVKSYRFRSQLPDGSFVPPPSPKRVPPIQELPIWLILLIFVV